MITYWAARTTTPHQSLRRPLSLIGSLLDAPALQPGRTGRNHQLWLARSQALPGSRADAVLAQVGLEKAAWRKAGGYSLGLRRLVIIGRGRAIADTPVAASLLAGGR